MFRVCTALGSQAGSIRVGISSTRLFWLPLFSAVLFLFAHTCFAGTDANPVASNSAEADEITAVPTLAGGDLYALLVGISHYKNPAVPPLNVSANDAKVFAEFLASQKELYKNIHIKLLVNEQATKAELEKYLYYELRKAGKNDTILMFVSGHGSIDPKRPGEFFFLTHDADPDFLETSALNMSGLKFLNSLDCPRVIMIADACHSGGFSSVKAKLAVIPMKTFIKDFSTSAGRVVITSSRPEEYSLEKPHLQNSVFTHYFLEGLKGAADQDGNGVVSINEAYNYVYNLTKTSTEGAQHPQFEGTVEGVFPVSVATNLKTGPVTSLELSTEPGADVLVGGKLVGKTGQDGSLFLKFLPLERPIPVKVKKEGWREGELGPYVFTKDKLHIKTLHLKLDPALSSTEIITDPPGVTVKINGEKVGTTGKDGRLIVHGVQVAVHHRMELSRDGYQDESFLLNIPGSYEGKKFKGEKVSLAKSAALKAIEQRSSGREEAAPRPTRSRSDDGESRPERSEPRSSPSGGDRSESRMGL